VEAPNALCDWSISLLLQEHDTGLKGIDPHSNVWWHIRLCIFIRVKLGRARMMYFGRGDKNNGWNAMLVGVTQLLK